MKAKAYTMFESWYFQHGHITLAKLTNERNFGKKLVGVAGFEGVVTGPRGHGQPRAWLGCACALQPSERPPMTERALPGPDPAEPDEPH
ncbi:hypothetical protein [Bradyrhizobium australafricanum]|uniref:hypothetical protein n=1 Tax=Bradyrhizobium australafricanum TaxID=2821406 RepID=UPI001CE39188|nr:hypothetical protein [Bradyrhizobium australafricanum]MCA6104744.1 hypothetical protein [Bradyrhizobium australafricanum]